MLPFRFSPPPSALFLAGVFFPKAAILAQERLPETVIIAERLLENEPRNPDFSQEEVARRSPLTIDQLLLDEPAFSLFRRQDATFSNPTAAGLSLRRVGATATSRTLLLRDGIPQNDPFGGWISWARYSPSLIDSIRIVPAAQATAWGNQSAAGTLQLSTREPREPFHQIDLTVGDRDTYSFSSSNDFVNQDGSVALQATIFALGSDGHQPLASSQRGSIDRSLSFEARGGDLRLLWKPRPGLTLDGKVSYFEEERGNGTVLTGNETEALDFSLRATLENGDSTYQGALYFQKRDFSAVFAAASDDRSFESVALDQFDVPATGLGGSLQARLQSREDLYLTVGIDTRFLDGETNERVAFDNRIRTAGGKQAFLGAFSRLEAELPSEIEVSLSARFDYFANQNGALREVRPDGSFRSNEDFENRQFWEPSLGLTVARDFGDTLRVSGELSTSFRAPTLNELYRPFRVRNDITLANPELNPERFYSAEIALDWTASDSLSWRNSLYGHIIDDAIANVPLTLSANGTTAQRLNVEEATVFGLNSELTYQPLDEFRARVAYQYNQTRFERSSAQPLLENEPFPQSPEHTLIASLDYRPTPALSVGVSTRFSSAVFDDALATRRLDSYWSSSISAEYAFTDNFTLLARVDNLFDETIATGLASNGLESLAAPRTFTATARYRW